MIWPLEIYDLNFYASFILLIFHINSVFRTLALRAAECERRNKRRCGAARALVFLRLGVVNGLICAVQSSRQRHHSKGLCLARQFSSASITFETRQNKLQMAAQIIFTRILSSTFLKSCTNKFQLCH